MICNTRNICGSPERKFWLQSCHSRIH